MTPNDAEAARAYVQVLRYAHTDDGAGMAAYLQTLDPMIVGRVVAKLAGFQVAWSEHLGFPKDAVLQSLTDHEAAIEVTP